MGERAQNAEIAFFGGSFTAIDAAYRRSLLEAAGEFCSDFAGIRISTRPDYINREILDELKCCRVTAIELGAQSMDNGVLARNERGHTAKDVVRASQLIQQNGFSLGLQMMTGLYGSDFQKDADTAEQFIMLRPDTVRIYPTVVMKGTVLERLYLSGAYHPYTLDESVALCAKLIRRFEDEHIRIIRLGLHYTDSLIRDGYCDHYHPAFKELCESKLFYDSFLEKTRRLSGKTIDVTIHPKSLSKFYGQKKSNWNAFQEMGYHINLHFNDTLDKYELRIGVSV